MIKVLEETIIEAYQGKIDPKSRIVLPKGFKQKCTNGRVYMPAFLKPKNYFWIFNIEAISNYLQKSQEKLLRAVKATPDIETLSGTGRTMILLTALIEIESIDDVHVPERNRNEKALLLPGEPYACREIKEGILGVANLTLFEEFHLRKYKGDVEFHYTML